MNDQEAAEFLKTGEGIGMDGEGRGILFSDLKDHLESSGVEITI